MGWHKLTYQKQKKKRKQISALKDKQEAVISDPKKLPNIMNTHFATIGKNLANSVSLSAISPTFYLNGVQVCGSFFSLNPLIRQKLKKKLMVCPVVKPMVCTLYLPEF